MGTHPDFADWYRRVNISPIAGDLPKRWQGVEAARKQSKGSDVADLVRLFYGLPSKDTAFLARFRGFFKTVDDTFPMRDNDAELRVLAGATLAHHFRYSDLRSVEAALAIVSAHCLAQRPAPVPEIVTIAAKSISDHAARLRSALDEEGELPEVDLDEAVKNLRNSSTGTNLNVLQGPFTDVLQPIVEALKEIVSWGNTINKQNALRREESDVLWWLFGETSRELGVHFGSLKSPSAILVLAKEMAGLVTQLPGPFAVEAFLDKAMRVAGIDGAADVQIADVVNACQLSWQETVMQDKYVQPILDLCPIHMAITKSAEAGGKKATWQTAFLSLAGFKANSKVKPRALAMQFYSERLLVRAYVDANEVEE